LYFFVYLLYLYSFPSYFNDKRPVLAEGSEREILQDIPYNGFVLPRGSSCALSFWSIMRTGIQQPDEFIPDRWSDDNEDKEKLKVLIHHSIDNLEFPF
jgi:cytochrome P450